MVAAADSWMILANGNFCLSSACSPLAHKLILKPLAPDPGVARTVLLHVSKKCSQ